MSDPSVVCTGGVKISDIWLINRSSRDRTGTFWLEISLNGQATNQSEKKRVDKDKDRIPWPEPFLFPCAITDQSVFDFKIVKTRSGLHFRSKSKTVGSCKQNVNDIFHLQKDSGSCKLDVFEDCHLEFKIEQLNDILPELLTEVNVKEDTHTSTLECTTITNGVGDTQDAFVNQFEPFLSQFKSFMDMMDKIAKVHPYVTLAWAVLSVIPTAITSQSNRDDSINALIQRMKEVYESITDAKRLPAFSETQSKTLVLLVQQTIECAYFIREYRASNIVIKTLKGISIDDKAKEFNQKFDRISSALTNSTILESSIITLRVSDTISELNNRDLLDKMQCAADVGFLSEKSCLPGTRKQFIAEILDWINNGSEQLLLLFGQAGIGKSAVAHTISQIFQKQNRLGLFFCFSRSYKDRRNCLFSTMSRHIANGDVKWRENIIKIIEDITVRSSKDITTQFEKLIIEPSEGVETIGPVVIIIDALDESGDRPERVQLLKLLRRCSELPSTYRFVITSRPEPDISDWSKDPTIVCKYMSSIPPDETTSDIQDFISSRLSPVKDILDNEVGVGWESLLAKRAEGLFQWASTVCDRIDPTVRFGVAKRAKTFISGPTSSLYQLYHQIIIGQPEFRHTDFLDAFKIIMGAIILMQEPPSVHALQSLFHKDVESILQPLHSLFLGIHESHTPVRPLHTSLTDFLTTSFIDIVDENHKVERIENPFYVDTSDHGFFTLACFKLLNDAKNGLRFNICNLETSHKRNRDVSDLDRRIQESIPPHLAYACCFWVVHLQQSKINKELLEQLHILMDTNLLYWFEVLSLLQKFEYEEFYEPMTRLVASFREMHKHKLVGKIDDALEFVDGFAHVMMESTPHLYLSALPFARNDSFIRRQFLDLFPRQFSIDIDHHWEAVTLSESANKLKYTDARFSPGDKYLMLKGWKSGHWYLQISNIATMNRVMAQIQLGHSTMAISPDDKYIAYISVHGLCLWNEEMGELLLDASTSNSTALAFSFTGNRLLSGDYNGRIIIWNTLDHTYKLISRPNSIHGSLGVVINALAFSTTGTQFLVAYTSDSRHLIEIKVSQSGETVKGLFADGIGNPRFAAFSTNDSHIVCIFDTYAVVLDAVTGQALQKFISPVLALSPSRKYILWQDETHLKLWDIDKEVVVEGKWLNRKWLNWGLRIPPEFEQAWHHPITVAFSNNSKEFIAMDENGEITIWNIYTGDQMMTPILHHNKKWNADAKLSSNGRYLTLVEGGITIVWSLEMHHIMSRINSKHRDFDIFPVDHSEEVMLSREAIRDRKLDNRDREMIEYALVAQEKALFSNSSIVGYLGWVLGPNGELLFWIPYKRRAGLWRPTIMHIAGPSITKLNFEKFVHGSRWTECKGTLSN